jgi:hypothetical protein
MGTAQSIQLFQQARRRCALQQLVQFDFRKHTHVHGLGVFVVRRDAPFVLVPAAVMPLVRGGRVGSVGLVGLALVLVVPNNDIHVDGRPNPLHRTIGGVMHAPTRSWWQAVLLQLTWVKQLGTFQHHQGTLELLLGHEHFVFEFLIFVSFQTQLFVQLMDGR